MNKGKKEHVAFVDIEENELMSDVEYNHVEEIEIDVDELKPGPPYVCKFLMPTNRKNPSEPEKNDNQIEVVYPKAGEGLLEFHHIYKVEDSEAMMFPQMQCCVRQKAAKMVESAQ